MLIFFRTVINPVRICLSTLHRLTSQSTRDKTDTEARDAVVLTVEIDKFGGVVMRAPIG